MNIIKQNQPPDWTDGFNRFINILMESGTVSGSEPDIDALNEMQDEAEQHYHDSRYEIQREEALDNL